MRIKELPYTATRKDGVEWLRALVKNKLTFHLEDDPHEIYKGDDPLFTPEEADIVWRSVQVLYSLFPRRYACPIAWMMRLERQMEAA